MANPWGAADEWDPEDWIPGLMGDRSLGPVPGDPNRDSPFGTGGGVVLQPGSSFIGVEEPGAGDVGGGGAGLGDRPSFNFGAAPRFNAPGFTFNERFNAPTRESVLNDPGYMLRRDEGEGALQRSAAARGLLRSGGTLKDLAAWSQNFASQEFGNVYDRALSEFTTRRDTAYGNYDRELKARQAEFAPRFGEWQTLSNAERDAALAQYARGTAWGDPNRGGGGGSPWDSGIFDVIMDMLNEGGDF